MESCSSVDDTRPSGAMAAPFMAWMQVCFEALPFVARLALKVMTSPTWQSGMVMYWFCPLKQIRSL